MGRGPTWTPSEEALLASLRANHPGHSRPQIAKLFVEASDGPPRKLSAVLGHINNHGQGSPSGASRAQKRTAANAPGGSSKRRRSKEQIDSEDEETEAGEVGGNATDVSSDSSNEEQEQKSTESRLNSPAPTLSPARSPAQRHTPSSVKRRSSTSDRASLTLALLSDQRDLIAMQNERIRMQKDLILMAQRALDEVEED